MQTVGTDCHDVTMDPKTNLKYLEFLATHLTEFIDKFDQFIDMHVENTGPDSLARGRAPAVFPKNGADPARIDKLTTDLHRLAGTLMDLSSVTDVGVGVQGIGPVDPFVNWATILQPKPVLEASNVRFRRRVGSRGFVRGRWRWSLPISLHHCYIRLYGRPLSNSGTTGICGMQSRPPLRP